MQETHEFANKVYTKKMTFLNPDISIELHEQVNTCHSILFFSRMILVSIDSIMPHVE